MSLQFLAVNLRRTRAERRRTQSEIAQAAGAGFSQQYVSALERGLQPSDPGHVKALAAALGVSVRSLTAGVADRCAARPARRRDVREARAIEVRR